jgi:hypothetical protein
LVAGSVQCCPLPAARQAPRPHMEGVSLARGGPRDQTRSSAFVPPLSCGARSLLCRPCSHTLGLWSASEPRLAGWSLRDREKAREIQIQVQGLDCQPLVPGSGQDRWIENGPVFREALGNLTAVHKRHSRSQGLLCWLCVPRSGCGPDCTAGRPPLHGWLCIRRGFLNWVVVEI